MYEELLYINSGMLGYDIKNTEYKITCKLTEDNKINFMDNIESSLVQSIIYFLWNLFVAGLFSWLYTEHSFCVETHYCIMWRCIFSYGLLDESVIK